MKIFPMLIVLIVAFAAKGQTTITVKSDRNVQTDFTKYKSFYWTSQVDNKLDAGYFFLDDLMLKAQIRDAVQAELMGLGYALDPNANLLVNFRVFDEPARIKGYEGYGTNYWSGETYRLISDTTSYEVQAGTLLISLVDKTEGAIVWQGFASGLIGNNAFVKDEGKIREAVNLIFEEYGIRAREYSKR